MSPKRFSTNDDARQNVLCTVGYCGICMAFGADVCTSGGIELFQSLESRLSIESQTVNGNIARNPQTRSHASRYTSRSIRLRELFSFSPRRTGSGGLRPRTHHARPGSAHDGERVTAPENPRKAPDHSKDAPSHGTRRRCALDPRAARDSDAVRDAEKNLAIDTRTDGASNFSNQQQPRRTLSWRPWRLLSRRSRRRSRYVTP